ncbi:hypothetical protein FIBSPDRAFT_857332, partial [Athelia psychrophila]
ISTVSAGTHDISDGVFRRIVSPEGERGICPMRPRPRQRALSPEVPKPRCSKNSRGTKMRGL